MSDRHGGVQPRHDRAGRHARPRCTSARRRGSSPGSSGYRTCWREPAAQAIAGDPHAFTIRPEKIALAEPDAPVGGDDCSATGTVREVVYLGAVTRYIVRAGRRRHARGDAAEPHHVVDGGAAGARQGRPPDLAAEQQSDGRGAFGRLGGVFGPGGGTRMSVRIRSCSRVVSVLAIVAAACGSESDDGTPSDGGDTGSSVDVVDTIGDTEGELNLIAWPGYTEKSWVKPFEDETGCKVSVKYGNTLRRHGQPDPQQPGSVRRRVGLGRCHEPADRQRATCRRSTRRCSPRLSDVIAVAQRRRPVRTPPTTSWTATCTACRTCTGRTS